ncbi:MAG TPA: hypothetical protein VFW93_10830, partial [Aquabacterium sp.]|uniref:hypothetical protein n=1 Tax=Aquabacterium sp. TaxID=1872578 RepID=UPI002E329D82
MKSVAFRLAAVSAVLALGSVSAHADLTIPFSSFDGNSVQTFTADDLAAFDLVKLTVAAKGNTYVAKAGTPGETNGTVTPVAFGFPITQIVVGSKLNIAAGSANGSALYFHRDDDDTGGSYGFTLANFTINYVTKQVLADVTPDGGTVQKQAPLYNFNVATPLALKYK